mmetsp:Transcript_2075/g.3670  ORF Transcript_2075/g.3670 Transcript_2075/m.3670 type:complete len:84 (+) Transcript_2075:1065-1316(+)
MQEIKHVFRPTRFSDPDLLGGHAQTLLTEIKDDFVNLKFRRFDYHYDEEEIFTLKDGGKVKINYKFQPEEAERQGDMLFLFAG